MFANLHEDQTVNMYVYTTEAWRELSQTQRVGISRLGQLQDLQVLLKDLLPLLRDNNKNDSIELSIELTMYRTVN